MALSWSMDKLGPLCRSVEDCAIVLNSIYGPDGHDRTVHDYAFNWDADLDIHKLCIGFLKDHLEHKAQPDEKPEDAERRVLAKKFDDAALDVSPKKLKIELIPVELPKLPSEIFVLS